VIVKPWSLGAASTTCTKSARFAKQISREFQSVLALEVETPWWSADCSG